MRNAAAVSDAAGNRTFRPACAAEALKLFELLMEQTGIILGNHKKFVSAISIAAVLIPMESLFKFLTCECQYLVAIFMPKGVVVLLEGI